MATVVALNRSRGIVAVETDGGYTFFDLLGDYEVDVGDSIDGDLRALGRQTFTNRTKRVQMSVFVQAVDADATSVRTLMG